MPPKPKPGNTDDDNKNSITVEFLDEFNAKRKAIETAIDGVALATKQVNSITEQVRSAFNPEDIERLSKQLNDVVKNAQKDAQKGKQLLDTMKSEGETLQRAAPKSDRLQPYKAQYTRLCKLYVDTVKEHQKAKENMRKVQTEDLVRRGMIIYGDGKSEGEIREKVEKDPANFVREAIMEEAADEAQQAYVEAQSRARDVEMLVRSLNEVAAMFQDLANLVNHQSEMLNTIEENVESATVSIKKGNQAMRDAIEAQKKSRKCMCCIILLVIICIIATVSGIGAVFAPRG